MPINNGTRYSHRKMRANLLNELDGILRKRGLHRFFYSRRDALWLCNACMVLIRMLDASEKVMAADAHTIQTLTRGNEKAVKHLKRARKQRDAQQAQNDAILNGMAGCGYRLRDIVVFAQYVKARGVDSKALAMLRSGYHDGRYEGLCARKPDAEPLDSRIRVVKVN